MVIYFRVMCYMTVSALNDNYNGDRLNVNGNNWNDNNDNGLFDAPTC